MYPDIITLTFVLLYQRVMLVFCSASDMGPLTSLPTQADTTMIQGVIVLILLTVAALGFLLYRYLCHNKGDYRTTGEAAPGDDPDDEYNNQAASEKKEYFI
uniref:Si:ch211-210c8.7 n=1 Tax=Sander lucioperca TaxID=283035 RepID=A0A8C9ZWD7_SANLU